MWKFIRNTALFFLLAAVIDAASGVGFALLRKMARGGQTYKSEYLKDTGTPDILILGSSRAARHYVPSILEDSLGLSCYNAGEPGCGIIPAYVRYKLVARRQPPKLLIYEVSPYFDYQVDKDYSKYLGEIRQYTDDKLVRDVFLDFTDELENLRLCSRMYRNNSRLLTNIRDIIAPPVSDKGCVPYFGKMKQIPDAANRKQGGVKAARQAPAAYKAQEIDSLKLGYLERLVKEALQDSVTILFAVSPTLGMGQLYKDYSEALRLCEKYGIPFLNNKLMKGIAGVPDYFYDPNHLNYQGAVAYTQALVEQLRRYAPIPVQPPGPVTGPDR